MMELSDLQIQVLRVELEHQAMYEALEFLRDAEIDNIKSVKAFASKVLGEITIEKRRINVGTGLSKSE